MPQSSQNTIVQMNSSIKLRQRAQTETSARDEPNVSLHPQWSTKRVPVRRNYSQNIFEVNRSENVGKVESEVFVDFVTANCQILTIPTKEEAEFFKCPDIPFPWDRVLGVRCYQTEASKCPICLEGLTAPRMGKCGHIYCLPCIKYCIRDGNYFHKCAVCFKPIEMDDLRRVYIVPSAVPTVGDKVTFTLIRRAKQSIFPKVVHDTAKQHRFLSRFDLLDLTEQLAQIEGEIRALESYAKDYEFYGSSMQAISAKSSIRKLKSEEKKVRCEIETLPPSDFTLDVESNNCYVYYQVIDGKDVYLHSINWKCLLEDYGIDDLPLHISGKVVEVDSYTMNLDLRRRYGYLKHLPIGRTFSIVEIEIENPVLTEETLKKFSEDIARRLQNRLNRQELELELDIEKELAENSYNSLVPESRFVGRAKLEGTTFSSSDFVPLEMAASSSFSVSSPQMCSFARTSTVNFKKLEPSDRRISSKEAWFKVASSPLDIESEFPPLEALTSLPPNTTHPTPKNQEEAWTESDMKNDSSAFFSRIKLSLKVSKFLYDASEFVHSFQVSQATFNSIQSFSLKNPNLEYISIRYQYEALCVMLQSMNVYSMYLEPEHRQILYVTAPQLLLRINRLGLGLALDTQAEHMLLTSLPRGDFTAGFRHGLSSLSFSPGTMEEINFNPSSRDISCSGLFYDARVFSSDNGKYSRHLIWVEGRYPEATLVRNLHSSPPLKRQSTTETSFDESEYLSSLASDTISFGSVSHHLDVSGETTGGICTAFGLAELGSFYYAICNYRLAYQFANLALEKMCTKSPSPRVVVQVLRLVCRICIIQRKYALGMKITQWLAQFTRDTLGSHNIVYANLLLDYGCLFLNTDNTTRAVELYRVGLSMLLDCLPGLSMGTALALEDLAYAFYVHEYSSGKFDLALGCAEKAIETLQQLGNLFCMQCASASRVKVLEEIAISEPDPDTMHSKLMTARDLHLFSLDLCERTFGVWNIQTAKHFGNLGRLFQSLEHNASIRIEERVGLRFRKWLLIESQLETAEEMHLKAIMIKERLLGPNDFEVGLSIGHLASLYNYHMNMYEKAEQLYLRSIQIRRKEKQ
ncbi:hypothetical protein ACTXT7_006498 [Hymenolepis weldensis]